jgi:LacI family transcriptional regulator
MVDKNVRIKDIARLAGVSVGTVDRVLHNRGRVSEDALKKVTAVMEQIDYKPNLIARTLGSGKSYKIALLVPDPDLDEYWSQSNHGIKQAEAEWGHYGVRIDRYFFDLFDKDSFEKISRQVVESNPDGIVCAPIFYHEALPVFKSFRKMNIPYVLFNTNIPEVEPLSFIGQDLYQSGRVGAELMNLSQPESGTLAVLHIDEDVQDSIHLLEKERGFRDYINEHAKSKFSINDFALNPKDPVFDLRFTKLLRDDALKGIFVSTSKGTSVAATLLEKAGKKKIRLIGYDLLAANMTYLKAGIIDFLINQNPKRQAFLGVSHLVNHLMFKKVTISTELFPLEVITQQNVQSYVTSRIH